MKNIDREIFQKVGDRLGIFAVDILPDASYYDSKKLDNATEDIMQIIIRELDLYAQQSY